MKVILPMAGKGSRFSGTNYIEPKPLISVKGMPMFHWALMSLNNVNYSSLHVTSLCEHQDKYKLDKLFPSEMSNITFKFLDTVPQGQLLSVLAHEQDIDSDEDILIISSDTLVISNIGCDILNKPSNCSGIISTINLPGNSWSFAEIDHSGRVIRVAEKQRISDNCSTGIYYFSHGNEFVKYAHQLITKKITVNGEYYIIPIYQEYIEDNKIITLSHATQVWDMGNPDALEDFLEEYK